MTHQPIDSTPSLGVLRIDPRRRGSKPRCGSWSRLVHEDLLAANGDGLAGSVLLRLDDAQGTLREASA